MTGFVWVEELSVEDVIEGKPLRVFPEGKYRRHGRILNLGADVLSSIADNMARGVPQFSPEINARHGREPGVPGSLGWIYETQYRPDGPGGPGLYATNYEFTDRGQELLTQRAYRYLSPEIVWKGWEDPKTGELHDNVLVGLALESKPYFGEELALFTTEDRVPDEGTDDVGVDQYAWFPAMRLLDILQQVSMVVQDIEVELQMLEDRPEQREKMQSVLDLMKPARDSLKTALQQVIADYGIEDEVEIDEFAFDTSPWDGAASRWPTPEAYCRDCLLDFNPAGKSKTKALCKLPYRHPGKQQVNVNSLRSLGGTTRGITAVKKPAGVSQDEFNRQRRAAANKVIGWWPKAFNKPAPARIYRLAGKTPPSQSGLESITELEQGFSELLEWVQGTLTALHKESDMSNKDEIQEDTTEVAEETRIEAGVTEESVTVSREEFEALQSQAQQVDKLASQLGELMGRLEQAESVAEQERTLRRSSEYQAWAEAFAEIPGNADELGAFTLFVSDADNSEDQTHFTWFTQWVAEINRVMEELKESSRLFEEHGSRREVESTALGQINAKVAEYMAANPGVARDQAILDVARQNPDLYATYRDEVQYRSRG